MQYILRCILDVEEDVIRDIVISGNSSLFDLHETLVDFFDLPKGEMASFYRSNIDWEQGEEIPLVNMNDAGISNEMKDFSLHTVLKNTDDKLLYVYDFLNLWTFFISLKDIDPNKTPDKTSRIFSIGKLPEKSPDKIFTSENINDDFDTEFDDDFDLDEDIENYY